MSAWKIGREAILGMLDRGELSKVPADRAFAHEMIAVALTHLKSVERNAIPDPVLAYSALHDAVRKAMAAVLQAEGLRATSKGGHLAVQYAIEAQFGNAMGTYMRTANRIRVQRNEVEYPTPTTGVDTEVVLGDLPGGAKIVESCQKLVDTIDVFI